MHAAKWKGQGRMSKAIIYTRFSPRRNAAESESCETQLGICTQYAKNRGYTIEKVHHDKDVSGKDEYRQKLWQAIEDLHKGDVLLVFKRDRLARNVYLAEQINRAVASRGASIEAVSGDVVGDGPEQILVRQVLSAIAEFERKMIASRTSYAMLQHQRSGRRMGRYAPYGYAIDDADAAKLIPVKVEQDAIALIRSLVNDGEKGPAIVATMNKILPDAARGTRWRLKTVQKIIDRL